MMAAVGDSNVVTNELLCFVQNNMSSVPRANIVNVGCTFYREEEIVQAKNVSYEFADSTAVTTSRCVTRRPGDNKRKLDFEDIINLWAQLDAAKVAFPFYAAVNLTGIPTVKPTETDIDMLAANMSSLKQGVQELSALKSSVVV